MDGITGTYNQQTFNNYALINVQCLTPSSFVWTGKLSSNEATNVKKLVVFLQKVKPFAREQNFFDNQNYMYCNSMENNNNCSGVVNPNPYYINENSTLEKNFWDFSKNDIDEFFPAANF